MLRRSFRYLYPKLRVDFRTNGLVLCPYVIDSNFIFDTTGGLWVVKFGNACFLTPSFVTYSLEHTSNLFTRHVAWHLRYPPSDNFQAMSLVGGLMMMSGKDILG